MIKFTVKNLLNVLAVVGAVFFCSASVNAETFEADGIFYKTTADGEVEVTKSTVIEGYSFGVNIPEAVVQDGKSYQVTAIGESAFAASYYLNSVTLPKTVKVIKTNAFLGCLSLKDVKFSEGLEEIGVNAFGNCAIREITLPSTLSLIKQNAFVNCDSLTVVSGGENVESIGDNAFSTTQWNTNFDSEKEELYIGKVLYYGGISNNDTYSVRPGTKCIAGEAFRNYTNMKTLNIPASVVSIGTWLFNENTNLVNVNFENENNIESVGMMPFAGTPWYNNTPDGEFYIGKVLIEYKGNMPVNTTIRVKDGTLRINARAFAFASNLKSIIIPNSVKEIGEAAFTRCSGLQSVVLSENLKELNSWLFDYCQNLEELIIPSSVETIRIGAVRGCTSLKKIHVPANVRKIEDGAFGVSKLKEFAVADENRYYCAIDGVLYTKDKKELIAFPSNGTTEFVIPDNIELADWAFTSSMLKSVTFPASFTEVGERMFFGCSELENVVFESPSRIKYIGKSAFSECTALKAIILPDSLEIIGNAAFADCTSLKDIKFPESLRYVEAFYVNEAFNNTEWESSTKNGIVYAGNMALYYNGEKPKTLEFKEGTKYINAYFAGSYTIENIETIILPESVIGIGNRAFEGLRHLVEVRGGNNAKIGHFVFHGSSWQWKRDQNEGVLYFGKTAYRFGFGPIEMDKFDLIRIKEGPEFFNFSGYDDIVTVNTLYIPKSIKSVAYDGFLNLVIQDTLKVDNLVPPVLEGDPCFYSSTLMDCKLCVPEAAVETYKKTPYWRLFRNIVGDPKLGGVETIETTDAIRVFADGGDIVIKGVDEGTPVEVFNLNGQTVYRGVETRVNVPVRGIYIVRVEGKVCKVAI